ncbi:hypothetical protein [Zoogloea sp.]|uniref:hypothetical protein n=1 Tax=Zoogloea sp. TaxID=49181 RepID=UPI0025F38819|nr:hypothetical protein [Zoogloea sp.]MCK6396138.1 hypothetical protein [Zoogloea sp.]
MISDFFRRFLARLPLACKVLHSGRMRLSGGSATENTAGLDWASNKRIPETYFEPYCAARPKVN